MRRRAVVVTAFGALLAEALMLYAGRENTHYSITALFIVWVASPFVLLLVADRYADAWPPRAQQSLAVLMLAITGATLAAYALRIVRPPQAQPAFVFVITPPLSWLLTVVVVSSAWYSTRRHSI